LNLEGIFDKAKDHADKIAFIVAAWERLGGIDGIANHYLANPQNVFGEVTRSITDLNLLKYKLLDSPHAYSGIFKISAIARILAELGIVPAQYKALTEKIMWGSGLAAISLPGSGPAPTHNYFSGNSGGGNTGENPFLRSLS
jgi:hypothetical protein